MFDVKKTLFILANHGNKRRNLVQNKILNSEVNLPLHICFSIVTVERISSYKLVNTEHDIESDPTYTM